MTYEDFEVIYGQLKDLTGKFSELNSRMSQVCLREALEEAAVSNEEFWVLVEKLGELRKARALEEAEEILTIYQVSELSCALASNLSPADGGGSFNGEGHLPDEEKGLAEKLVGRRVQVKVSYPSENAEIEPGDGVIGDEVKDPWFGIVGDRPLHNGIHGHFSLGKEEVAQIEKAGKVDAYREFIEHLYTWLTRNGGVITREDYNHLKYQYSEIETSLGGIWFTESFYTLFFNLATTRYSSFKILEC